MRSYHLPEFIIERDKDRCNCCRICEKECAFEAHRYDEDIEVMVSYEDRCVGCQRCVVLCPKNALIVRSNPTEYRHNYLWTKERIGDLINQAETGSILLTGCGNDKPYPIYWDNILINASQVTNPSIDPLREPMDLRTFLGGKAKNLVLDSSNRSGDIVIETELPPNLMLETPILFSALSYGAISYRAFKSLAMAAKECGIFFNTGEGGFPKDLRRDFGENAIVQCASGRFGVDLEYLCCCGDKDRTGSKTRDWWASFR